MVEKEAAWVLVSSPGALIPLQGPFFISTQEHFTSYSIVTFGIGADSCSKADTDIHSLGPTHWCVAMDKPLECLQTQVAFCKMAMRMVALWGILCD